MYVRVVPSDPTSRQRCSRKKPEPSVTVKLARSEPSYALSPVKAGLPGGVKIMTLLGSAADASGSQRDRTRSSPAMPTGFCTTSSIPASMHWS